MQNRFADVVTGDRTPTEALAFPITSLTNFPWETQTWVRLVAMVAGSGDHDWAEAITALITDPYRRAKVLAELTGVAATHGDPHSVVRVATEAKALTTQITYPLLRSQILVHLAGTAATIGDLDRAARWAAEAEVLTSRITDPEQRVRELVRLAEAVTTCGDLDRAARLRHEAETQALSTEVHRLARPWVVSSVVEAMVSGGDLDRAEALVRQITDSNRRSWTLVPVIQAVAAGGDLERAEALAALITDPRERLWTLPSVVRTIAVGGDLERAETLAAQITDPYHRSRALISVVAVVGADQDRATRLGGEAEALIRQITDLSWRATVLTELAEAVAAGADPDRAARLATEAEALATQHTDSHGGTRTQLAMLLAASGDPGRAEALVAQIADPSWRAGALVRLVKTVAGDRPRAERLAHEAEALAAQITDPDQRAGVLASLAGVLKQAMEHALPARGAAHSNSHRSRTLLAEALVTGSWTSVVCNLALVDPQAVNALADELEVRWGLDPPGGTRDGRER